MRIDHAAIKREQHLDGKWLLRTSDLTLTPDDLAAAYKQLLAVERGWRDFKGVVRPGNSGHLLWVLATPRTARSGTRYGPL